MQEPTLADVMDFEALPHETQKLALRAACHYLGYTPDDLAKQHDRVILISPADGPHPR